MRRVGRKRLGRSGDHHDDNDDGYHDGHDQADGGHDQAEEGDDQTKLLPGEDEGGPGGDLYCVNCPVGYWQGGRSCATAGRR